MWGQGSPFAAHGCCQEPGPFGGGQYISALLVILLQLQAEWGPDGGTREASSFGCWLIQETHNIRSGSSISSWLPRASTADAMTHMCVLTEYLHLCLSLPVCWNNFDSSLTHRQSPMARFKGRKADYCLSLKGKVRRPLGQHAPGSTGRDLCSRVWAL